MRNKGLTLFLSVLAFLAMVTVAASWRAADVAIHHLDLQAEEMCRPKGISDVIAANRESEVMLMEAAGRSPLFLICIGLPTLAMLAVAALVAAGPSLKELRLLMRQWRPRRRSPRRHSVVSEAIPDRPALPARAPADEVPWLE